MPKTININAKHLQSFLQKFKGLANKKNIFPVYFETRFGIHTFGMTLPIDVIILDNNHRVVLIKKKLIPGNVFFWNPKYKRVLELPHNFKNINKGDVILLT